MKTEKLSEKGLKMHKKTNEMRVKEGKEKKRIKTGKTENGGSYTQTSIKKM